jgi:hypothetical protein
VPYSARPGPAIITEQGKRGHAFSHNVRRAAYPRSALPLLFSLRGTRVEAALGVQGKCQ